MKRNSLVSLGLIGIMTLAISGCNGFEEQNPPEPSTKGNFVIMVVPETRTEMSENTVVWSADDKLSVFVAENGTTEYGGNVEFTHDSGEKFTGDLTLPSSSNDWYVLYPYNSEITTPANTSTGATRIGSAVGSYQEQNGNNSSAHLVGQYFPLYGKTTAVPSAQVPAITLNQALSILKVHVTNKTAESLTVNEVSFTGTEAIAGSFYINFTGENAVMTPVDGSSSNTAILKVKNGAALATDASADFYLAIKPFTATSGSTLTLAVNGYEKTIELTKDASFKEGKIRTLNYDTPTEFPPLLEDWEETALSDINAGDVFVIVGNNSNGSYAMSNDNGTSAAPSAVSVTVSGTKSSNKLVGDVAANLQWNVSGNATDGYTFYPNGSTDTWLYCTNTNNGVRVGTNDNKIFTIADNGYLYNSGTSRYVGIYDSSNWRCYSTINKDNIPDQTFAFYRQTSEYAKAYAITKDPGITGGTVSTTPSGTQYEGQTVTLTATPADGYLFTSWDVYKTGDSETKIAVSENAFTMPSYDVTVSAVFGPASLVVGETTPAKAECTAGAEVTFTVTSNVEWTASTEDGTVISSISPVGPQSPSADAQTVTITFTANTGAERTADIDITPVAAAYSALARTVTVTQKEYTAPKIIDTLNNAWTGITGTSYTSKELTGSASGVTYSVNAAGGNSSIQLRSSNNNSGIVTKTSGGIVKKVTVKWNGNTTDARVLDVYGKNTAYSEPSDLYDAQKRGTQVTSFAKSAGDGSYTFTTEYEYIGFRSNSGALYLDEITIEWGEAAAKYAVTIDDNITNGTVEASAASIAEGETVTLTVTPDAGYVLDELTVFKTGDASTTVPVTNNAFTMPGYDVTVTATFDAVPTMNVLKSALSAPAAAGTYTETGVYELLNGASDDDVDAIGDGDVVTDVEWENGNLIYTVSANTGAAREGTILISYDGGEAEEITVSQAAATYQLTLTAPGEGYSITATVGGAAVATATTTDQNADVEYGSTVSLSATAPSGYTLDEWTVTGATLSGNQFTMTGDVTVSATFVSGKDGKDPANPYTVAEALEVISHYASGQGGTDSVYVSGIVVAQGTLYQNTRMTYFISDDGTSTDQLQVFRGWYIGGAAFSSVDQLEAGSTVVVYGQLFNYNGTTPEINADNRLYSVDGYTSFLTLDTFSVTTDNTDSKKDITVQWAASGSANTISYTVTCAKKSDGTESQSYNANAAGSHTFSVSSYDTDYTITVTATAEGAIPATRSQDAKVADPGSTAKWNLVSSLSGIKDGTYAIAALYNSKYYTVPNTTIAAQTFTCLESSYSATDGLTPASGSGEFTFTAVSGVANAFYIYNTNLKKYLVATGSKKFGYVDSNSSDYGYWTFSTVSSGGFSGQFSVTHSSKTHYMRAYNNSVRCYDGTSNNGVYLFIYE